MRLLYKNDLYRLGKAKNSLVGNTLVFVLNEDKVIDIFFSETPECDLLKYEPEFEYYHILRFETKDEALTMLGHYENHFKMNKVVPLIASDKAIKVFKNHYIKKDDRYYFNINGLIFMYEKEGKVYSHDGFEYRHPDNAFGELSTILK